MGQEQPVQLPLIRLRCLVSEVTAISNQFLTGVISQIRQQMQPPGFWLFWFGKWMLLTVTVLCQTEEDWNWKQQDHIYLCEKGQEGHAHILTFRLQPVKALIATGLKSCQSSKVLHIRLKTLKEKKETRWKPSDFCVQWAIVRRWQLYMTD